MTAVKKQRKDIDRSSDFKEPGTGGSRLFSLDKKTSTDDGPIPIIVARNFLQAVRIAKLLTHKALLDNLMEMVKDSSVTQEIAMECEKLAAENNVVGLVLAMFEVPELREKLEQWFA